MCMAGLATGLQQVRGIRDNVHSLTGMGSSETRGAGASPTVNVYTNQPSGDVTKNTDDLKMPTQGGTQAGQQGGQTTWKSGG